MPPNTTPTPPVSKTPLPVVAAPTPPTPVVPHSSAHIIEITVGVLVFVLIAAIFVIMLWYGGQPKLQTAPADQNQVTQPVAEVPVEQTLGGNLYAQVAARDNPLNSAPTVSPISQAPNPFSDSTYKNPFTQ